MPQTITINEVGKKVTFNSKNVGDTTIYSGEITGIISHSVAATYSDLVSYNGTVRKVDADIANPDELSYFLMSIEDVSGDATRVFANEWISAGSLKVLDLRAIVTLEVYDLKTNKPHTNILDILKASGYTNAKITKIAN